MSHQELFLERIFFRKATLKNITKTRVYLHYLVSLVFLVELLIPYHNISACGTLWTFFDINHVYGDLLSPAAAAANAVSRPIE